MFCSSFVTRKVRFFLSQALSFLCLNAASLGQTLKFALWSSTQSYYYNKEEPADNNVALFSALAVLPHTG